MNKKRDQPTFPAGRNHNKKPVIAYNPRNQFNTDIEKLDAGKSTNPVVPE